MSIHEDNESQLLGMVQLDPAVIDRATAAGVTADTFGHHHHREQWRFLCDLAVAGKPLTPESIAAELAASPARLERMGGVGAVLLHPQSTTLHADAVIRALVDASARRNSWLLLKRATEGLESGAMDLGDARQLAENAATVLAGQHAVHRILRDIADEAMRDAQEALQGTKASRVLIKTGLPTFDRYATPMESHEYIVVGARTSHGKSSFLCQVAGHAIAHGQRVAFFTLETSDKSVLTQIVAQRAAVCVKRLHEETAARQQEYLDKLKYAGDTKNLLIFDRDLTLAAIEARCRLLANGFKPHLVVLDYLGLVGIKSADSYERMSMVSKAMIPLRKLLGCALMVGAQLNRGPEKEEREPTRTDFRDAGGIEEDAHRIIALWRKPGQALDLDWYDSAILQLKLRDGPLTRVDMRFHGPTTRFVEAAPN